VRLRPRSWCGGWHVVGYDVDGAIAAGAERDGIEIAASAGALALTASLGPDRNH
jgi:hypothetical protein